MTVNQNDAPESVRLMTDGGTDRTTVTKARRATEVVTREVDGDDQDMLRVPISSTRADREGDRFAKEALEDVAEQIRSEQPMVFDNHGLAGSWMDAIPYDSRETVGAQMDAELESAEDGEWDLYALVNPDGTHPEGERMLKQVRDEGQPLKFSVGFGVEGYEAREDVEEEYEGDGRVFTSADLMETSRVGIPANPDASVQQSLAAKNGAEGLPGYQNHPVFQMMRAMAGEEAPEGMAAKDAVDSDVVEDATPVEVDGDATNVDRAAAPDGGKEDKPKCDSDADCPDGEVCQDGHCVPEDEADDADPSEGKQETCPECGADLPEDANYCPQCGEELGDPGDDDGDEESSEVPDAVRELREENQDLREEIDDVREQLAEGRGDAKTGDTDMSPPETDDTEDEQDDDTKTAMDVARGS